MSNDVTPPITVTDNTLEGQFATLGRYLLATVGAYALGKGWVSNEVLQMVTGLVTVAAPIVYGIYKTYTVKKRLIAVAQAAPDHIATVIAK